MKYAIIKSGIVENIIEWDGTSEYQTDGVLVETDANAWIGGVYADGAFVARPPEPEPEPTAEELQAQADKASAVSKLEALGLTDAEIKALSGGL
tara:strand:- start:6015 stop:6296 length:282 start_codon:yes stop_codon:yes gene_type:complete